MPSDRPEPQQTTHAALTRGLTRHGRTVGGRRATGALAALLALLLPGMGRAGAQTHGRLDGLFPAGGRRGDSVSVILSGEGLADVREVVFGGTGVTGQVQTTSRVRVSGEGVSASLASQASVQIRVSISRDADLGPHEVRLVTGQGVTNARFFEVSDLPEWMPPASSASEGPWAVSLPATINGRLTEEDQVHAYRFNAAAGQQLVFDVKGERLGSSADLTATLVDSTGQEVSSATDSLGLDPLLRFTAPATGAYTLRIEENGGLAGPGYYYRVAAGALPYIDSAFPQGGQRGTSVETALGGDNLDGTATVMRIDIAADAPLGPRQLQVSTPAGSSNAWPFLIGDLPEVVETLPEDASEPRSVGIPIVINGRVQEARDTDTYRFTPQAGDTLVLEVAARRIGSPLDSLLVLEDPQGKEVARNDDAEGKDSRLIYTFPSDPKTAPAGSSLGEYRVRVQDAVNRGGPAFNYRLTLRKPAPDFALAVEQEAVSLPAGGNATLPVRLTRLNGFDAPVRVVVSALPGGLTATSPVVPPDQTTATVTLSAPTDAARGMQWIQVEGVAEGTAAPLRHTATTTLVVPRENDALGDLKVAGARPIVTVVEPPPFALEIAAPQVSLRQRGRVQVLVRARRDPGFVGPVRLGLDGPPPGLSAAPGSEIRAGEDEGLLTLAAADGTAVGPATLKVRGTAVVGSQEVTQSAGTLPVVVTEAPGFSLSVEPAELALPVRGTTQVTLRVQRVAGFTGPVVVSPGAAAGISASPVTVPAGTAMARMAVTLGDGLKPGQSARLSLTATGTSEGEEVTRSAALSLRVLEPPGFALSLSPTKLNLVPGASAEVTLSVTRRGGFTDAVEVTYAMPPGSGLSLQAAGVPPGGASTKLRVSAASTAEPAVVSGIAVWGTGLIQGRAVTQQAQGKLTVQIERKPAPPPPAAEPKPNEPPSAPETKAAPVTGPRPVAPRKPETAPKPPLASGSPTTTGPAARPGLRTPERGTRPSVGRALSPPAQPQAAANAKTAAESKARAASAAVAAGRKGSTARLPAGEPKGQRPAVVTGPRKPNVLVIPPPRAAADAAPATKATGRPRSASAPQPAPDAGVRRPGPAAQAAAARRTSASPDRVIRTRDFRRSSRPSSVAGTAVARSPKRAAAAPKAARASQQRRPPARSVPRGRLRPPVFASPRDL